MIGKEPKHPHLNKKIKQMDIYNIEAEETNDKTIEKDIWDKGSKQPHRDLLAFHQKPYEHRKCTTAFCIAQKYTTPTIHSIATTKVKIGTH